MWQDHFGYWLIVCTGDTSHRGVRFVRLRTRAVAERLSSTSKQVMPESLGFSGCHFRKVKSYALHPRGFLLVPVVTSLFYFIHTVKNKNVIKYSSKTPISNVVIYLLFSLGSRVCSVNHATDYYSYLHVRLQSSASTQYITDSVDLADRTLKSYRLQQRGFLQAQFFRLAFYFSHTILKKTE